MPEEPVLVYDQNEENIGNITQMGPDHFHIATLDGEQYRVPSHFFTHTGEHWLLIKPVKECSDYRIGDNAQTHVDELSEDSFPASDPPDYTLG
ncbi:hypothetical protein [Chromohalobacter israelensis]|uniref:hypothetical protein n=1 Tax=Chromohalobacter israelensis TaxID=141390 RepID=UPI000FFF227A|nr:hypothetical protein [Chromohalobacter salexigens]